MKMEYLAGSEYDLLSIRAAIFRLFLPCIGCLEYILQRPVNDILHRLNFM